MSLVSNGGPQRLSAAGQRAVALTVLGLMIPAATFSRNLLGQPGSLVLAGVLLVGYLLVLGRAAQTTSLPRNLIKVLLCATPVVGVYAVSTLIHPSPNALVNTAQLLLAIGFMAGLSLIRWDRISLRPLFWIFAALLVLHVLLWFALGTPRIFRGFMGHANALGLFTLVLSFVPMLTLRTSPRSSGIGFVAGAVCLSSVVLLVATGSRASWLAATWAIMSYVLWTLFSKNRVAFHLAFLLTVGAALSATWLYSLAPNYAWGRQLQELSVQYTGQNFFSGRQLFWGDLERAIMARPWFGYGAGSVAESFTGYTWSSHNLYLQTALQVGFVGLAALIFLLWVLWAQLWQGRRSKAVRLSSAYFLGILIHQVFEVSLTQNSLANGFLIWFILAVGLSHSWRLRP